MANLARIMTALYCQPWLITAAMHYRLCEIARDHMTGAAHDTGGRAGETQKREHGPVVASGPREWWQDDDDKPNGVEFRDGVAVFDVGGVIGRKFSGMLNSSGVTSIDVLSRMVKAAAADDRITAIVLDIDSPGGTVAGVPEMAQTVRDAAAVKPVVAYTGGLMASAAYWLGVGADAIFAGPSAEIGSIGVYSAFLDQSRAYEIEGYRTELFKTGKYKGMGIPGLPLTDDQRALIQADVDTVFGWFKAAVRANRGNVSDDVMQGQTLFGEDARAANLIDRIGTLDEAIAYAKQHTGART
jgi:signal peptide peptidase SppA